jgi:hypothetical protein
MARKVHVSPGGATAAQAKVGIAVATAFLIFGLVFGAVIAMEGLGPEPGLAVLQVLFLLIWVGVCVSMIVSFSRIASRKGPPGDRSLFEVQVGEQGGDAPAGDFETRLRKLEALKRDGLLSEEEYRAKRDEVMREKW